jgi:hypothetical protein
VEISENSVLSAAVVYLARFQLLELGRGKELGIFNVDCLSVQKGSRLLTMQKISLY